MRVTQTMLTDTTVTNVENNLQSLLNIQEQLSTGKSINQPSDNPVGFSQVMSLSAAIDANSQYKANAQGAIDWLNTTDSALQEGESVMARLRQLTVQASSDTLTQSDRSAIADEVDQLNQQMQQIGNTQLNGEYIFAGTDVQHQPYPATGTGSNNTDAISLEMGDSISVQYNTLGTDVFGSTATSGGTPVDPTNIFTLMTNLSTALRANDTNTIQSILPQLDQRNAQIVGQQSIVGAKVNRLNLLSSRIDDQNLNLGNLKSQTGDADMASLITQLNQENSVYQASLAAGARMIEPTLMNYLSSSG